MLSLAFSTILESLNMNRLLIGTIIVLLVISYCWRYRLAVYSDAL